MQLKHLIELVRVLSEPAMIVSPDGEVRAANRSAIALAPAGAQGLCGSRLSHVLCDPPEQINQLLSVWAQTDQPTPGTLTLRSDGRKLELHCEGAAIHAGSSTDPPVILLRCHAKSGSDLTLLNERVRELSRQVAERHQAELLQAGHSHVLEMLAKGRSLEDVLAAVARLVEQQMPGILCSILLLDEDGLHLRHGAAPSLPEDYNRAVDGVAVGPAAGSCGTAAFRGEPVLVEDIEHDPLWADFRHLAQQHGLRVCWSYPITSSSGGVIGTLAVYYHTSPRTPEPAEVRILETASRLAGIALDRKHAEQQLRQAKELAEAASRAKDHFLAILSHELRTPLTPVLAIISALERQDLPPELHEDIAAVRRSIELEARLIDDLLDLTRIERGKLEIREQQLDVHAKIRNAIRICQPDADRKHLRIQTLFNAQHHHAIGDPARLQQVFWNLLANAIKFTPTGGRITVKTWDSPEPECPRPLIIQIHDTGIGIEPDIMSRIFDPFEQGEKTITRHFGGLGLGLAITKSIVELHGGLISAHSEGRDRGTTFTLQMPTIPAPLEQQAASPPAARRQSSRSLSILLVEDNAETSRAMVRLLRGNGHEVTAADSVAEAVRLAAERQFDMLISDIGLPDGSGLDLMRQLRAMGPIKGIVLSGYGMEEDIRKSHEAGFTAHLIKPVSIHQLEARINEVCCPDPQPQPAAHAASQ